MSPEKQKVAIAEACGWTWVPPAPTLAPRLCHPDGSHYEVPEYPTDLNAIHKAELAFIVGNEEIEFRYRTALVKVLGNDWALIPFASAAQKAEAMLRAIGKWEDVDSDS